MLANQTKWWLRPRMMEENEKLRENYFVFLLFIYKYFISNKIQKWYTYGIYVVMVSRARTNSKSFVHITFLCARKNIHPYYFAIHLFTSRKNKIRRTNKNRNKYLKWERGKVNYVWKCREYAQVQYSSKEDWSYERAMWLCHVRASFMKRLSWAKNITIHMIWCTIYKKIETGSSSSNEIICKNPWQQCETCILPIFTQKQRSNIKKWKTRKN